MGRNERGQKPPVPLQGDTSDLSDRAIATSPLAARSSLIQTPAPNIVALRTVAAIGLACGRWSRRAHADGPNLTSIPVAVLRVRLVRLEHIAVSWPIALASHRLTHRRRKTIVQRLRQVDAAIANARRLLARLH